MTPAKVTIWHGPDCRCRVVDGAIYVASTCHRFGNHVTKRRLAQLIHVLKKRQDK